MVTTEKQKGGMLHRMARLGAAGFGASRGAAMARTVAAPGGWNVAAPGGRNVASMVKMYDAADGSDAPPGLAAPGLAAPGGWTGLAAPGGWTGLAAPGLAPAHATSLTNPLNTPDKRKIWLTKVLGFDIESNTNNNIESIVKKIIKKLPEEDDKVYDETIYKYLEDYISGEKDDFIWLSIDMLLDTAISGTKAPSVFRHILRKSLTDYEDIINKFEKDYPFFWRFFLSKGVLTGMNNTLNTSIEETVTDKIVAVILASLFLFFIDILLTLKDKTLDNIIKCYIKNVKNNPLNTRGTTGSIIRKECLKHVKPLIANSIKDIKKFRIETLKIINDIDLKKIKIFLIILYLDKHHPPTDFPNIKKVLTEVLNYTELKDTELKDTELETIITELDTKLTELNQPLITDLDKILTELSNKLIKEGGGKKKIREKVLHNYINMPRKKRRSIRPSINKSRKNRLGRYKSPTRKSLRISNTINRKDMDNLLNRFESTRIKKKNNLSRKSRYNKMRRTKRNKTR